MLDARGPGLPRVVHWGGDVGDLDDDGLRQLADAAVPPVVPSSFDEPTVLSVLPEASAGWSGRPGLAGHRDGRDWSTCVRLDGVDVRDTAPTRATGRGRTSCAYARPTVGTTARRGAGDRAGADPAAGLTVTVEITLDPYGLLTVRHRLRNDGDGAVRGAAS